MGVLPKPRKVVIPSGASSSERSSAVQTDDESGRSTPAVVGPPLRVPPLCPAMLARSVGYRLKMKKGRRSKQRFENERMLMTMFGIDGLECEPTLDVNREYTSYFSDLLESENSNILEEFLNNEESKYFNIPEEEEEERKNEEELQAEEAFLRIGAKLRCALKKNVPLGMLRGIEETLNQNFSENPTAEFICEMSSFERLLVHALSAYNSLNSYSYCRDGRRIVKVENPRKVFLPKDPTLTDYLAIRNHA